VSRPPALEGERDSLPRSHRQRLLLRLLRSPDDQPLRRALLRVHPADIAPLFAVLNPDQQQRLIELLLELKLAGRTLRELDEDTQTEVLAQLSDDNLAPLIGRLNADDAADVLALLDEERRERVLERLDRPLAVRLRNLLRYGEATAGGLMNPDVISFPGEQSVGAALERIRSLAGSRRLFYLYVTDEHGRLIGIVNLWQLVSAASDSLLRDVMSADVARVEVDTPQEDVARLFAKYDLLLLPVVDGDGRLAGVITADDVLDVVEEEATEDLYRLANLDTQESLATTPPRSVRLRLPWLLINLATAFLAAWVVSLFQETIARYVMLAVFMPIVAGMGGNAGTQSLTVMVRGLALGEMDLRQASTVIGRQALVGLLTGLATGALLALVAWVWERNLVLAGILLFAQTVNLFVAGLFGSAVPLVLRRLDLDPALGSSIFVTTATDCCGFFAFLGTATLLVERLLPAA
jgi:magnesium transporter